MEVDLVKRLLTSKEPKLEDIFLFITTYVKEKKNKDVTTEELNGIFQLFQIGAFNFRHTLMEAANSLELTVLTATDKLGNIISVIK